MTENTTIESMFEDFLESQHTGEIYKAVQDISAEIDRQGEAGAVQSDTVASYEYAAMRYGFYAGVAAALELARTA